MLASKGGVSYEAGMKMPSVRRKILLASFNHIQELANQYAKENAEHGE